MFLILAACAVPSAPVDEAEQGTEPGDVSDSAAVTLPGEPPPLGTMSATTTVDIAEARWGVDAPNTVKSYPTAFDPVTGRLWVTGIQVPNLIIVDPTLGHPVGGVAVPVEGHHSPMLRLDAERRILYWIARGNGGVIAFDADTGAVIGRNAESEAPSSSLLEPAVDSADIDVETGVLWLCDSFTHKIVGYPAGIGEPWIIDDVLDPRSIALDQRGGLFLFDGATASVQRMDLTSGARVVLSTVDTELGHVAVDEDGDVVLVEASVHMFNSDGTERWTAEIPGAPLGVAVVGDTVAVTSSDLTAPGEEAISVVHLFDVADGNEVVGQAAYGADQISADAANLRLFVSNGSDGSVSVVDAVTRETVQTLSVANVPDGTAYDPITERSFILNRLGGSVIHTWDGAAMETWEVGAWPTELVLDAERRRLFAPTHFDGVLRQWDLDSDEELAPLSFGVPPSSSDTIGDIDYDPSTGIVVGVFPESGAVAAIDTIGGTTMWGQVYPDLFAGIEAGSGENAVVVDAAENRLYVFDQTPRRIIPFVLSTGERLAPVSLPAPTDPPSFVVSPMWLDTTSGLLYIDELVVSLPDLDVVETLPYDIRGLCRRNGRVYGVTLEADQATESLVVLDAQDHTELGRWTLGASTGMRMDTRCDLTLESVVVADLELAEVRNYTLP